MVGRGAGGCSSDCGGGCAKDQASSRGPRLTTPFAGSLDDTPCRRIDKRSGTLPTGDHPGFRLCVHAAPIVVRVGVSTGIVVRNPRTTAFPGVDLDERWGLPRRWSGESVGVLGARQVAPPRKVPRIVDSFRDRESQQGPQQRLA